jgi:hypothetical protein
VPRRVELGWRATRVIPGWGEGSRGLVGVRPWGDGPREALGNRERRARPGTAAPVPEVPAKTAWVEAALVGKARAPEEHRQAAVAVDGVGSRVEAAAARRVARGLAMRAPAMPVAATWTREVAAILVRGREAAAPRTRAAPMSEAKVAMPGWMDPEESWSPRAVASETPARCTPTAVPACATR